MRRITQHITNLRLIPRVSVVILSLLLLMMLYPAVGRNARVDAIELSDGQSAAERDADVSVIVQSAISLSLSSRIDIDAIPKANGNFSASTADLAVATNNASGYSIYMHTADNSPNLKAATGDETAFIAPVTGSVTPQNFAANTWGYSLTQTDDTTTAENLTYQAVPTTTAKIEPMNSAAQTERDYYQLHFGTMVDTTLPAGVYTNAIVLSVVANPREIQTLGEAVYMQDFDGTRDTKSKICAQSRVGETKQLIDTRDGKKYWVAKLADGNCWMTQNLAYHLVAGKILTPADTDLTADWSSTTSSSYSTPNADTNPSATGLRSWGARGNQVVLARPQVAETCTAAGQSENVSVPSGQDIATNLVKNCPLYYQDISSWIPGFEAQNGTWNGKQGFVAVDETTQTYDAHYLVGYYYQYGAVTAGSGNGLTTEDATSSICPKGWKLPSGRNGASDVSIGKLLADYGYPNPQESTQYAVDYPGATRLDGEPLYFARNGLVHIFYGSLRDAAGEGYYRASTSDSSNAYRLHISKNEIVFDVGAKFHAYSVRCVAR